VSPPSLTAFGWRELQRALAIALLGTVAVVMALGRRLLRIGRARGVTWIAAICERHRRRVHGARTHLREAGQMVASSPSVFPKPLADACLRCSMTCRRCRRPRRAAS